MKRIPRSKRIELFERIDEAKEQLCNAVLFAERIDRGDNEMAVLIESWEVALEHMVIPEWLSHWGQKGNSR